MAANGRAPPRTSPSLRDSGTENRAIGALHGPGVAGRVEDGASLTSWRTEFWSGDPQGHWSTLMDNGARREINTREVMSPVSVLTPGLPRARPRACPSSQGSGARLDHDSSSPAPGRHIQDDHPRRIAANYRGAAERTRGAHFLERRPCAGSMGSPGLVHLYHPWRPSHARESRPATSRNRQPCPPPSSGTNAEGISGRPLAPRELWSMKANHRASSLASPRLTRCSRTLTRSSRSLALCFMRRPSAKWPQMKMTCNQPGVFHVASSGDRRLTSQKHDAGSCWV